MDEDTEGSSKSGPESVSTSGDNMAVPGLNGSASKEDGQRDEEQAGGGGGRKKKKKADGGDKDKDKDKAKKSVLKGLGEMFR